MKKLALIIALALIGTTAKADPVVSVANIKSTTADVVTTSTVNKAAYIKIIQDKINTDTAAVADLNKKIAANQAIIDKLK